MPGSRNTLLRRVRGFAPPGAPPAEVIGIDDWAKRKGHTYGTIVVDLDRHRPVDVLPDRRAETVAAWMKVHPEVGSVSKVEMDCDCCHTGLHLRSLPQEGMAHDVHRRPLPSLSERADRQTRQNSSGYPALPLSEHPL